MIVEIELYLFADDEHGYRDTYMESAFLGEKNLTLVPVRQPPRYKDVAIWLDKFETKLPRKNIQKSMTNNRLHKPTIDHPDSEAAEKHEDDKLTKPTLLADKSANAGKSLLLSPTSISSGLAVPRRSVTFSTPSTATPHRKIDLKSPLITPLQKVLF